jgi:hypothetical protein
MNQKVTKDNLTDLIDEIKPQTTKPAQKPSGSVSEPKTPKIVAPDVPPSISEYEVLLPDGTKVTLSQVQKSIGGINMSRVDKPPKSRVKVIQEADGEYVQIVVEEQIEYVSPKLKVIKK